MNRTRALLLVAAVPLLIVIGLLASAVLGDGGGSPAPRTTQGPRPTSSLAFHPRGARRVDVGRGPTGAAIFRPAEARDTGPIVVFLHGWFAVDPRAYGAWIGHLVRGGATVIYPAYQEAPFLDTVTPLANTLVALRLAFEAVPPTGRRLVVAGHSAGGALAADYAASAGAARLPAPAAVFSVYPGRALRGIPLRIPTVDAHNIPARTRVLVLAGAQDRVVGTGFARTIARTATQANATLRIVRDRRVDSHGAPQSSSPTARRTFWAPLDRLLAATG